MADAESLAVSLSFDSNDFESGLVNALNQINAALEGVAGFMEGFAQGLADGMQEAAQEAQKAENAINGIGDAANSSSGLVESIGRKVIPNLQKTSQQAKKTAADVKNAGSEMVELGNKWGSSIKSMLMGFAGPVLGALGIGSMVNSYFSGVAQVAQMTGRYTSQMEEWRRKRELLSRVTKEDVELYRKGKLALLDFEFAMQGLSTTLMRALTPVLQKAFDVLKNFGNWIRSNEHNITRFFQAIAIVVTAALIPAFVKWGRVLMANPIFRLIAILTGLVFIVDDLLTYIHGGESLFASFWSRFGTGAEIAQKMGRTLENLKRIGVALFNLLLSGATKFFGYLSGAAEPILNAFSSLIRTIAALVEGDFSGALDHFLDLLGNLVDAVLEILGGLGKMIADLFMAAFNGLGEIFGNFISGLMNKALMWIKGLIDKIPDWMKPDSLIKWSASIDAEVRERAAQTTNNGSSDTSASQTTTAPDPANPAASPPAPDSWDMVLAAVPPSATNNQTKSVKTNTTVQNMTINTQATDPQAIMQNAAVALQQASASLNTAAADGGVR